jgi:hypothetical protein
MCYADRVRRLLAVLLFLLFVEDAETVYGQTMFPLFGWAHEIFYLVLPIKVRPFDILLIGLLVAGAFGRPPGPPRVVPMRNALLLSAATLAAWFVYGIARGGDARAASWQIYLVASSILLALTLAGRFYAREHWTLLAKVVVAAATYRAVMCWYFYFAYVRTGVVASSEFITSHEDTVLFVTALIILGAAALERRRAKTTVLASVLGTIILGGIMWNGRRIAWVSLAMGVAAVVALLRPGPARRRVIRTAVIATPILGIYVLGGLASDARIFWPVKALTSVASQEDASSKARHVENLGLIATANQGPLLGTGWGHKYEALSDKYSIAKFFELWPYVPHNSILGILAYTGMLGFAGLWLAFPTAIFLNARVARFAESPQLRSAGIVGVAQMIVCVNQMYGDMGLFSYKTLYVLAASYAMAMRLPTVAGVWGSATAQATVENA